MEIVLRSHILLIKQRGRHRLCGWLEERIAIANEGKMYSMNLEQTQRVNVHKITTLGNCFYFIIDDVSKTFNSIREAFSEWSTRYLVSSDKIIYQ